MVFVKEESEENMIKPETCRIKHEEPEPLRIKHEEPEPWRIKHEEPEPLRIKHEEPEPWRIKHEEPEPLRIKHEEPEPCRIKQEKKGELTEESEENEELSEVAEENHVKPGEKPLSCSQTKKKKRTDKSIICTQCGMGFAYKYNLDVHMRVHTGEKPYKCLHCDKRFSRSGDLRRHERKPCKCSHC
ncbi:zinc finger protein 184-like [Onychostoma macrolepis]|uniref:C2H2-type domain-containing protein n=1 Tax=Onychostoma macrolepis TaxID=369639 RepID=A0A7J6D788_9TELE|nr:zinc finger protein 184-like [Onychostoma macrolepis]KAF4115120.1 hypothetical protein G5714_002609 [Onychostoma macrolepis]